MDRAAEVLASASHHVLVARAGGGGGSNDERPPAYKAVGISLAIASGVFIGISFVMKKVGLLKANVKYNEEAGEGYGYLKNAYWWTGMTLMIIGEICNFVAYAFVDAILVTPLGALSVVITTILSAIFLKERLSFVGKAGCFICIIGSVIIVLNAPEQSSVKTIQDMQHFVIAPGFLSYAGVVIIGCAFVAFWVGPRYGKKSMLVYLTICSLVGGLSVVATQGLGAAVVAQAGGTPQFNQWFLYVLLVFVVATLLTEIIFLNKALNLFNAALVTPTYYVYFTSATIVSSAILFRGFKGSPTSIATIVMGFLQICTGVVLLQLSKSAKDVPDSAVFAGDLDQVRTVAEQEQPESEPKADAIRGTAALIRQLSTSRQKMEAAEAKQVHEDRMKDTMESIGENEQVQWDGIRRRKTLIADPQELKRRKSMHPPLGMTRFPSYDEDEADEERPRTGSTFSPSFFTSFRRRTASSVAGTPFSFHSRPHEHEPVSQHDHDKLEVTGHALETIPSEAGVEMQHVSGMAPGSREKRPRDNTGTSSQSSHHGRPIQWAGGDEHSKSKSSLNIPSPRPSHIARRQFSFQNLFHRSPSTDGAQDVPTVRKSGHKRGSSHASMPKNNATEEELHGLVQGDSQVASEDSLDVHDMTSSVRAGKEGRMTAPTQFSSQEHEGYISPPKGGTGSDPKLRTPGGGRPLPRTPTEEEIDDDSFDEKGLGFRPLDMARKKDGGGGSGGPPAYL